VCAYVGVVVDEDVDGIGKGGLAQRTTLTARPELSTSTRDGIVTNGARDGREL